MTFNLIIKEEAAEEIESAFNYYEEKSNGLGLRFINDLEYHLNLIQQNPHHYSFFLKQKKFRSSNLENFPFSIIYEVTDAEVAVYSVHNHYKDPGNLFKKLQ